MAWGDSKIVKQMLSIEDEDGELTALTGGDFPSDNIINNALTIANGQIDGRLKKNLLKISGNDSILDTVANWYALAESLEPIYSNVDDENEKSKYYNSRADGLLDEFIEGAIKEQNQNRLDDNPYSVGTTNDGSTYGEILRD